MPYFSYQGKSIYYEEMGEGKPVALLHGNTASSKMFTPVLHFYASRFRVILIDFLGHGRSDRLERFPDDLWFEEGLQTIALIDHLPYPKVDLIGSSGGALAAINAALESPSQVGRVVADSFEGECALPGIVELLCEQREASKQDEGSILFYSYCQGEN